MFQIEDRIIIALPVEEVLHQTPPLYSGAPYVVIYDDCSFNSIQFCAKGLSPTVAYRLLRWTESESMWSKLKKKNPKGMNSNIEADWIERLHHLSSNRSGQVDQDFWQKFRIQNHHCQPKFPSFVIFRALSTSLSLLAIYGVPPIQKLILVKATSYANHWSNESTNKGIKNPRRKASTTQYWEEELNKKGRKTWKSLGRSGGWRMPLESWENEEEGDSGGGVMDSIGGMFSSPTSLSRSPMHSNGPPIPLIISRSLRVSLSRLSTRSAPFALASVTVSIPSRSRTQKNHYLQQTRLAQSCAMTRDKA